MIRSTVQALNRGLRYLAANPLLLAALLLAALIATDVLMPESAWAGPGGQFVKAVTKTWWGKALLGLAAIILLPLALYVVVREWIEVRRCRRDLAELEQRFPFFGWNHIEARARETIETLYRVWGTGDLSSAAPYLMPDYLQAQQDLLDRWKAEGKHNVFSHAGDISLAPLHVGVENEDSNSLVVLRSKTHVIDYMEHVETGKKLKGSKSKQELESCLVCIHVAGEWMLSAIEEGDNSLAIASEKNVLDASYLLEMADGSQFASPDGAQDPAAAESEKGPVGVAEHD